MKLLVNLVYDREYKGYVADVPELPGCMSQGKTVESALKNIRKAISLYVESLPPKKRSIARPAITTTVEV
jgi:predicted RNase H-like HicB family nuclease